VRFARRLAGFAIFAVTFLLSAWVFAPWNECGALAFEELRALASSRGFYITCEGIRREGLFPPRYIFSELDVEGPMAKATFREASVRLEPLRALLAMKAAISVSFDGASVRYVPKNGFEMRSGGLFLMIGRGSAILDDINIDGDFSMTGGLALDVSGRKITRSDAVMRVPLEFNLVLNSQAMSRHVEQVSQGEWRIKANAD
jgi:hypothetical protein